MKKKSKNLRNGFLMKKSGLLLTQYTKNWGETTSFYGARAALPLEEEDRVEREKEKIVITHRNHGLENSTFLVRYPML